MYKIVIAAALALSLGLPALAHEGHNHEAPAASPVPSASPADAGEAAGETPAAPEASPGCTCQMQEEGHEAMHEHMQEHMEEHPDHPHEHHEDTDFSHAFAEGTPDLFSPSTVAPDHLVIYYSHQFFLSSLPRGSNPAFWFKYSPLEHLQIDAMATLRSPLELEAGVSYQILDEHRGDWLNLTPRLAFNSRGTLFGGEVAASKYIFPEIWQVGLDARLLSTGQPDGFARPVAAVGFNTMVRVWKHWHLFGDVVVPLDGEILQKRSVLWTAGIKKRLPHTPHILTLFIGNTQEQSLSGRTISSVDMTTPNLGLGDILRLGFVFSINIDGVSRMSEKLF